MRLNARQQHPLITRKTYVPGLTLERDRARVLSLLCPICFPQDRGGREGVQPAPVCPRDERALLYLQNALEKSRWVSRSTGATLAYQPGSNA